MFEGHGNSISHKRLKADMARLRETSFVIFWHIFQNTSHLGNFGTLIMVPWDWISIMNPINQKLMKYFLKTVILMGKIGSQESLKIMIIMKKHGVPDWKYHSSLLLGLIKPNKKYKQLF